MTEYSEYYVGYVDILGFADATNTLNENDPFFTDDIDYFIEAQENLFEILNKKDITLYNKNVKQFSDCAVISLLCSATSEDKYEDLGRLNMFFSTLHKLQLLMLEKGFLLRGAITKGKFYHKDNIILGPALNKAVDLEQKTARYPRIIISKPVMECIKQNIKKYQQNQNTQKDQKNCSIESNDWNPIFKQYICHDQQDTYYINYFRTWNVHLCKETFLLMKKMIQFRLNESRNKSSISEKDKKIYEKYEWLAINFNKMIDQIPNRDKYQFVQKIVIND
jgi:hypothetical protein